MALTLIDTKTNSGSSSTPSVTAPSGISGDTLIVIISHNDGTLRTADNNGGTPTSEDVDFDSFSGGAGGAGISVYNRVIGGSEPGTYNYTMSGNNRWVVVAFLVRGADSSVYDVSPSSTGFTTAIPGTSITSASITTATDGAMAIAYCQTDNGSITAGGPGGSWNEIATVNTQQPVSVAYLIKSPAGATGNATFSCSSTNITGLKQFAIKPLASSTSPSTSPSVSVSPSISPSASVSPSRSVSPSVSPSSSVSPSRSVSPSVSPSASTSPSISVSPSTSPSASVSPSSSISPSTSPSISISPSASASPSTSPSSSTSPSASISPSVSPSVSISPSVSVSPSTSPSSSASPSESASSSPSVSPSISSSASPSISPSTSPSVSASPSTSPSASTSPSQSVSPSTSPSSSTSPSVSISPSISPSTSISPSISVSISPSSSPSTSPSVSISPSTSPSASVSPSASASPSVSPSQPPEGFFLHRNLFLLKTVPGMAMQYRNLRISSWNTINRPTSPKDGDFGFNTDTASIEIYLSGIWYNAAGAEDTRIVSDDYTLFSTDGVVFCNSSSSITITLPTAVGLDGKIFTIKNVNSGVVTVDTTSMQTIDGDSSRNLNQYDFLKVISNNSNWSVI